MVNVLLNDLLLNKKNSLKKFLVAYFYGITFLSLSQPLKIKNNESGILSLGVRTTVSLFNDSETGNFGTGAGGQFRLQLAERVNTDWFFDYLTADVKGIAHRTDYHIGWSVLFYPYLKEKQLFKPYILAGHCFDYSKITENANRNNFAERWSSAVQMGIGTHINLTQRLDFTVMGQYMIHLGNEIHPEVINNQLVYTNDHHHGASLEGHLLITLGIHYKIVDLWGGK